MRPGPILSFDPLIAGDGRPSRSRNAAAGRRSTHQRPLPFVYTLLTHDVQAALETVGLDPPSDSAMRPPGQGRAGPGPDGGVAAGPRGSVGP